MALTNRDRQRLDEHFKKVQAKTDSFIGYPVSKDFDFSSLNGFLSYPLNNLGDPFTDSTWQVDSREFEREVVNFMAKLFRAEPGSFWGYVTNGGTEGNLYGLYLAREMYPTGIVYYSEDTHYSVKKNLHLLNMKNIMIRSQENGEIDYIDLQETMKLNRDKPAIMFANIGTTMTEAKDDLTKIKAIIRELAIAEFYIHSDAALCGGLAPFIEPRAAFDFVDGADSISVSGHKSFGSPVPCGVVIAKKANVNRISKSVAYIGCLDNTITGSRNGLTPLLLWYTIKHHGERGLKERVTSSLAMAKKTEERLREAGIKAWRNPNAITVVMPAVPDTVKEKWQLATSNGRTHIILMPNIEEPQIEAFLDDIKIAA